MKFEMPEIKIERFDLENIVTESAVTIAKRELNNAMGDGASIYVVGADELSDGWSLLTY